MISVVISGLEIECYKQISRARDEMPIGASELEKKKGMHDREVNGGINR